MAGDRLIIYLAVSEHAVSSVLVKEVLGSQHPIYYVSKRLLDTETKYPELEKLALALVSSSRKLRRYFMGHSIDKLTNHPLKQVLRKPEVVGRLTKWRIELTQYDITYKPQKAIKGQALANFIAKFTFEIPKSATLQEDITPVYELFVDSPESSAGVGVLLIIPEGHRLNMALQFTFKASNNEAEYEALIARLQLALDIGVKRIKMSSDSKLIVRQVIGEFITRDECMMAYLTCAKTKLSCFFHWEIHHVLRAQNVNADTLAKLESARDSELLRAVPIGEITTPSITPSAQSLKIDSPPSWMDPIREYRLRPSSKRTR